MDDEVDNVKLDGNEAKNTGLKVRAKTHKGSKVVTFIGRPHVDIFHLGKLLPPGVDMTVKLVPSNDAFVLIRPGGDGAKEFKLEITAASIITRRKRLSDQMVLAHKEVILKKNIRLPYSRVQVKTIGVQADLRRWSAENVYTGTLPDRVIVAIVRDKALAGTYDSNPFNFEHFDITRIQLFRNGTSVPRLGYHPDFTTDDYTQDYLTFQEECGYGLGDKCVPLSPDEWADGFTVFAFKVTPGPIGPGDVFPRSMSITGTIKLEIDFAKDTPENLKIIFLSESPGVLEFDQFMNPVII